MIASAAQPGDAGHRQQVPPVIASAAQPGDALAARLAEVLAPVLGSTTVTVEALRRLTGGASRATWAFDAVTATERRSLILRTGPPDETHAGMALEAQAQAAAAAAGAPVPDVLVADDSATTLGNPFLICAAVAGETVVRRIDRALDDAGRAALLEQCAAALAAIHRSDPAGMALAADDPLAQCRSQLDARFDSPDEANATFEWAFRWLAAHHPPPAAARLVHGDFRMGNVIVDGSRLAAVLDWELVHLGDVCEDLAWFCLRAWRFGAPAERAAGGLGSVEAFLAAYQRAGGHAVDPARFHWWLVLGTLRWGVICRWQAQRHLSGQTRSVELATIGRRVCESEWDLLMLLGEVGDDAPSGTAISEAGTDRPVSSGYGRPTAAELVAAVADFLDTDVRSATDGQVNFHSRVAANALRIVERELRAGSTEEGDRAMAGLGFADEAALAAAIRAGEMDGHADAVHAALAVLVRHRLAVAHPGYDTT